MDIRRIIKEEIDDLEWARELLNQSPIPKPDGNRYVLRFKRHTPKAVFERLNHDLTDLGWKASHTDRDVAIANYSIETLVKYSSGSGETYIHLKPDGFTSIGFGDDTFHYCNGVHFNQVPNIWIN